MLPLSITRLLALGERRNDMKTRIYEHQLMTYVYDTDNGVLIHESKTLEDSDNFQVVHIFADEGHIFRCKSDGTILTNHISIGSNDSVDNYEEVPINS